MKKHYFIPQEDVESLPDDDLGIKRMIISTNELYADSWVHVLVMTILGAILLVLSLIFVSWGLLVACTYALCHAQIELHSQTHLRHNICTWLMLLEMNQNG